MEFTRCKELPQDLQKSMFADGFFARMRLAACKPNQGDWDELAKRKRVDARIQAGENRVAATFSQNFKETKQKLDPTRFLYKVAFVLAIAGTGYLVVTGKLKLPRIKA